VTTVEIIVLALMLDALLGEPETIWSRVPHPAVLMGRVIDRTDQALNRGNLRVINGLIAVIVLVFGAGLLGVLIVWLPLSDLWQLIIATILLAHRSLMDHVRAVAVALGVSVDEGRRTVAMIVGRDTGEMDQADVARAAIESAAENFSDGVIAPVFWFVLFGAPGLLIYKVVNTADSMIGYKTAKYQEFGMAAARLDDLMNWIPARLSAGLIWLVGRKRAIWADITSEAVLHRSPNAGWPEAAVAHVLDLALSGPRRYDGALTDDPFVNGMGKRALDADDIGDVIGLLWRCWAVMLGGFVAIALLIVSF
jgi:adenosylcobinamide-phosphate synthase